MQEKTARQNWGYLKDSLLSLFILESHNQSIPMTNTSGTNPSSGAPMKAKSLLFKVSEVNNMKWCQMP